MTTTQRTFDPPGPGPWERESAHFPRPVSRFMHSAFLVGFPAGFREGTERYGVMLSHFKPAIVQGFMYQQPVAFGAPEGAAGPPPKLVLQLLTRLVPKMRRRLATSQKAFEGKLWREDLKRWDDDVKPAAIRAHLALQRVDVTALDDAALATHLAACRDHLEAMITQHHRFTIPCSAPVGDFMAHAAGWTGKAAGEILHSMKGSSEVSKGVAAPELDRLASAIRESAEARAILEGTTGPADALVALERSPGAVGETARAYLEAVGLRCLGYDIAGKSARELPDVLVRAIRSAVVGENKGAASSVSDRVAALRDAVPAEHRARFDELLVEARLVNRLRDERGHYSEGWAIGIVRRAVLEAGRRLVARGKLSDPEVAVDATCEELTALLLGKGGPSSAELEAHAHWRSTATLEDAPPFLNAMPGPPPPAEWLPEHGRRGMRAIGTFIHALFTEPPPETTTTSVKGLPVSPGIYEGRARLVSDEADFGRIENGDILVTRATSPYFNVVLPLLGGIVTDRGGQLCHAAIVSREYGIPGVVGTRDATTVIKDGQRIRVNGSTGEVQVLA